MCLVPEGAQVKACYFPLTELLRIKWLVFFKKLYLVH